MKVTFHDLEGTPQIRLQDQRSVYSMRNVIKYMLASKSLCCSVMTISPGSLTSRRKGPCPCPSWILMR